MRRGSLTLKISAPPGCLLGVCPCPTQARGGEGTGWGWLGAGEGGGLWGGGGVSAAPHRGASGKSGGGSRWRQVDFDTGVGPVPSGVCTAPSESRPPCWGGSGCLGVRGPSGCPGGLGLWAKAAQSPASKGCQRLGSGLPLPPRSWLCSPILLPISLGLQPPPRAVFWCPPPAAWGSPAGLRSWGSSRAGGDGFPVRLGRGRTRVDSWVLCPPHCGWGMGLGTPPMSPWGPWLCWRDMVGEVTRQMLAASLDFGIRHQPLWTTDVTHRHWVCARGWHRVHRGTGMGAKVCPPTWCHHPGVTLGCGAEKPPWRSRGVPQITGDRVMGTGDTVTGGMAGP